MAAIESKDAGLAEELAGIVGNRQDAALAAKAVSGLAAKPADATVAAALAAWRRP